MVSLVDHLIHWSIRNRALVLLLAAVLFLLGLYSLRSARFDVLPQFTPPIVTVQTEAPGLGTLDVEALVTTPLEQALLGTPEATSVRSTSAPGLAVVHIAFAEGVDPFLARQMVTERLREVHLPDGVEAPRLAPMAAGIGALLKVCLTGPDPGALRTFGDWTIAPRLRAIPGVAHVTVHGGDLERIEVRPDPTALRQRDLGIDDVVRAVRESQATAGGGYVVSGDERLQVRAVARLDRDAVRELSDTVVATRAGVPVRLADVARVLEAATPPLGTARYDGKPAVYLQVDELPWADTLRVTREVETALHGLALPPGAHLEAPVFRQADFVLTSIRRVGSAMLLGGVLVVLVLVAFLRSPRLAAISLVAIPLSILVAMAVLVASGATINGMTLGGLAIAVGEVVDDAIVDVENVWRRLCLNARQEAPRPALEVVQEASREVRGSVVYATVIVCLVLLPVLLLGGLAGRIFAPLAQAYVLAIVASLGVALTVTPALCAALLPPIATAEARPTRLARGLRARYRRLLAGVIDRPRPVLGLAGGAVLVALLVVPFLGGRFLPEFREGTLIGEIWAAPGTSLVEATRLADRVDAQARPRPASHTAARAGRVELEQDTRPVNQVEMDFQLAGHPAPDEASRQVSQAIARVPGLGFSVEGFLSERIHEVLSGETAPVVVQVLGPRLDRLRRLATRVTGVMRGIGGLEGVRMQPQVDVPQLQVRPERDALARWGITPADLLAQVVAWRQGRPVTEVMRSGGRVEEVAVAGPEVLRTESALRDLPMHTPRGDVPLSGVARIVTAPAPASIDHDGGVRRIAIGADAPGAGLSRAVATLERRLAALKVPAGYRVEVGGEAAERARAGLELMGVGGLVLAGIFALLAAAFGSFSDAGIVLLNLPLGLVGGVLAALAAPEGLSVAGFVGFITLFGIISRNGILLVAHHRQLVGELPALDPVERVKRAAEERLLPIVMTAACAGLGLLPLALSVGRAGSELEAPMALIVCGGLLTSTSLNMIVLPTVYAWRARRQATP